MPTENDQAKSLMDRLEALLKPKDDFDEDEPRGERALRLELTRVRELRRKDREEAEKLRAQVEELSKGYEKTIAKIKEESAGEVARLATTHHEERSLLATGITDPETISEVRAVWQGLDTASRPKTPGEYAKTLLEASKDPKKAESIPRRLQGFFQPPKVKDEDPPNTENNVTTPKDKVSAINGAKSVADLFKALA